MTAEVRRHVRRERDRILRSHLRDRHVLFCTSCGRSYDVARVTRVTHCYTCRKIEAL
jgi:hypothetical protein